MTDTANTDAPKKATLTVTIDGRSFEADPGELLIAAAERAGVYIPRFCWHPRMREVGMCRMCLVDIQGPRGFALQPACMQPVADGMVVQTQSPAVKKAQDGVLEFLLINHPLDCPVCDKGGECPLQDQTLTFGPGETRFVEEKRHYEKPIAISPLVLLDRERCILCDRCTRFAKDVAGDPLIHFVDRGAQTEVNTFPDHPFASYFSGNVAQICPVGALTTAPFRFVARPWDMDQVESTCTMCAVGCRIVVQSSGDRLLRYQGVDADPVNWGWLCDKGRFSHQYNESPERLGQPQVRASRGDELAPTSWHAALSTVAERLQRYPAAHIGLIGGARLTNEDQYAWAKLAKGVLGTDNVDAQLGDGLPATTWLGLPPATIDDAADASAVLLLGPDLKEELPVLFLRLRDAAVHRGLPVIELTPRATATSEHARHSLVYRAGEASAAVRALLASASGTKQAEHPVAGVETDALNEAGAALAAALTSGRGNGRLVVVLGRPSLAESPSSIVEAAQLLVSGVKKVAFLPALRRSNLRGALDLGLSPGLLPGRVTLAEGAQWFARHWAGLPAAASLADRAEGLDTAAMLTAAARGELKALVLLGADPLADFPDRGLARAALERVELIVAVDLFRSASVQAADVVLPAAAFAERSGTTTNLEGRISRTPAKVTAPGVARPDWMIAVDLASHLGPDLGVSSVAELTDEIARVAPSHLGIDLALLAAPGHGDGVLAPLPAAAMATPQPAPDGNGAADASGDGAADASGDGAADASGDGAADASGDVPDAGGTHAVDAADGAGVAPAVPPLVSFVAPAVAVPTPQPDAYSLRLISSRVLYDQGTLVQHCPVLADLAPGGGLHLHHGEMERHGLRAGGEVRVVSGGRAVTLPVVADDRVPRGTAFVPFGQAGVGAAELIDAEALAGEGIVRVRLETVGE